MLPPTYSRRKRLAENGEGVDVYQYDTIPARLRVQVVHVLRAGIGPFKHGYGADTTRVYNHLVKERRKELGVHTLVPHPRDSEKEFFAWIEATQDTDEWLSGVELALQVIDNYIRQSWSAYQAVAEQKPDDVITEINGRFLEAGFGYQYQSGRVIRVDNLHTHREIVLPALTLLRERKFQAAEVEYRSAHAAYRAGELEDCLVDCAKAFESVLKVIAKTRSWPVKDSYSASQLIDAAARAKFLPAYCVAQLNHLKGLLESSTPAVRNKMGGHGAGETPRVVPQHLAAYQLNQTAAAILFLAAQDEIIP